MNDTTMADAHAEFGSAETVQHTPQSDIDLTLTMLRDIVQDVDYPDRQVRLNAISMLYQVQVQQRIADQQANASKPASH